MDSPIGIYIGRGACFMGKMVGKTAWAMKISTIDPSECRPTPMRHFFLTGEVVKLEQVENGFEIGIRNGVMTNTIRFVNADLVDMPEWLKIGAKVEYDSEKNRITLLG